jgi:hypothetical protein
MAAFAAAFLAMDAFARSDSPAKHDLFSSLEPMTDESRGQNDDIEGVGINDYSTSSADVPDS